MNGHPTIYVALYVLSPSPQRWSDLSPPSKPRSRTYTQGLEEMKETAREINEAVTLGKETEAGINEARHVVPYAGLHTVVLESFRSGQPAH